MKKVLILLASALALGGCGDTVEVHPSRCSERCFRDSIINLSSIDHETPSGEAIREIHAACEATSEPCCMWHVSRLTCPEPAPAAHRRNDDW